MSNVLNRSGVRRNLNASFNDSVNNESPTQNYSIIDLSEEENPLLIKLRKSRRANTISTINKSKSEITLDGNDLKEYASHSPNFTPDKNIAELGVSLQNKLQLLDKGSPYISVERLNVEPLLPDLKQSVNGRDIASVATPVRRSNRKVQRVSYAELISPFKTPRKNRNRSNEKESPGLSGIESPLKKAKQTPKKNEAPNFIDEYSTPQKKYSRRSKPLSARSRKINTKHSTPVDELEILMPEKDNLRIYSNVLDNEASPRKKKKSEELNVESNNNVVNIDNPKEMRTPSKNGRISERFQTPKSLIKHTPSSKAKLVRCGLITPSVKMRATPIKSDSTPLNRARQKLHVSYLPNVLPCREKEYNEIFNFLEGKLHDGCGGCIYVSGVPGTGKTATVTDVIRKLEEKSIRGAIPSFQFISLNGMKLSEPRQSYVEILRQLTGKTLSWEQAQSTLDTKFTKPTKTPKPIILLVDELDILCTKRQDVVYNLLDWPTRASVQLIVVTIANTMDLPERLLMGRVTSRLGLTRITFQAYTHKQLQEIVTMRLMGAKVFNPDAVQLVARKVASVSGDARRALDICRRAAEIAELEGLNTLVTFNHVNEALNAMITQPKVKAIKYCSRLQQLILQAVVAEVERTGVEETTFANVYTIFESIAALDGFQKVSSTLALSAVSKLGACRLLLTDQKPNDYYQKIILNVSADDVYYALRKD